MLAERAETGPVRPAVPVAAWMGAGVWTGAVVAERMAWSGDAAAVWGLAVAVSALVVGAFTLRWRSAMVVLLAFACGMTSGSLYWRHVDDDRAAATRATHGFGVRIASDPRPSAFGASSDGVIVRGPAQGAAVRVWIDRACRVELGDVVDVGGRLQVPARDERGRREHRAGRIGAVRVTEPDAASVVRAGDGVLGLRRRARRAMSGVGGPAEAILAGIALGDRRSLTGTAVESDLRACGLSHLVVVSGAHLAIVAALITGVGRGLAVPRGALAVVVLTLMGGFVLLTGAQASAVRAAIMAAVGSIGGVGGRRSDALAGLGLAVTVMVLWWPAAAFSFGFRLSCAAVLGIVALGGLARSWFVAGLGMPRWLADTVAVTVVAQLATMPLAVPAFGMVSLIAPAANLVVSPIVQLALVGGLLATCMLPIPGAAPAAYRVVGIATGAIADLVDRLASLPGAAVLVGPSATSLSLAMPALGVLAWLMWPRPRRVVAWLGVTATAALVVLAAFPAAVQDSEVVVLDVGQGDAVLARSGGRHVLVDAGPDEGSLRAALAREDVRRLDALVITHMHDDHTGGYPALRGTVAVSTVLGPAGSLAQLAPIAEHLDAPAREVRAGDVLRLGDDVLLRVVSPDGSAVEGENERSVVCIVESPSRTVLLTGDAEVGVLGPLVSEGVVGDVDAMKVGHHGSLASVDADLLGVVRPELAVISVGEGNRFGHPRSETIDLLERQGAEIRRTDRDGDVTIALE